MAYMEQEALQRHSLLWSRSLPSSHSIYSRQNELHSERSGLKKSTASHLHSAVDDSDITLDPNKSNVRLGTFGLTKDILPFTREKYSAARTFPSLPVLDLNQQVSTLQHKHAVHEAAASTKVSDLTLNPNKTKTQPGWFKEEPMEMTVRPPFPWSNVFAPPSLPVLDLNQQVSTLQHKHAVHQAAASSKVSDLTLNPNKTKTQPGWFKDKAKEMTTPRRFTPDLVQHDGVTCYRFQGLCPGVFQCELTGLVFKITCQGQVLYRIIQWDEGLLLSAKKVPAGPLFSIQGSEDAVSQLHLPHCEKQPFSRNTFLDVAHIGDDGMSILQPVEITDTHVVVRVPHFSAFGLVWDMLMSFLNIQKPIHGQVLLFHRLYTRQTRKLNIFLLPENVPLQEVKKQQENTEYIEAPSSCHLIRDQTYSLHCPEAYKIQPQSALFDFKYGPNYHPTFEIRLTLSTEEATVVVQDHEGKHAWEYQAELNGLTPTLTSPALSTPPPEGDPARLPFPTKEGGSACSDSGSAPLSTHSTSLSVPAGDERPDSSRQNLQRTQRFQGKEEEKLFSVRTEFVNRVSTSVIKDLLDKLLQERVVNSGEMESIQTMTRAEKARELIDMVLKKGQLACRILIDAFCELDPFLSELLRLQ